MIQEAGNVKDDFYYSQLGFFPVEWRESELDRLNVGQNPAIKAGPFGSSLTKDVYVKSGYKVYGQEQVIRGDHTYGDYYIDEKKYRQLKSCSVSEGDILLSLVGTAGKLLVIMRDAEAGVINPRLLRFRFDGKKISSNFFKYLFESEIVQHYLENNAQGGTMAVLNAGMLKNLPIPLPSLEEQTAIANALSDVDALLCELEKLIAKKQAIKTATMQQLLTGKTRLPQFATYTDGDKQGQTKGTQPSELGEIPEDWVSLTLDDVCCFVGGAQPEKSTFSYKQHSDYIRLIQIRDYKSDKNTVYIPEKLARKKCDKNDIMIGRYGPPIFQILRGLEGAYNVALIKAIPANCINREFLYYILKDEKLFELMDMLSQRSSGQTGVELPALKAYPIGLPSDKEQTAIAAILTDMDEEIQALKQRLSKTRQVKQGMMQELLTGKTRLPFEKSGDMKSQGESHAD